MQSPLTAATIGFENGVFLRSARLTTCAVWALADKSPARSAREENALSPAPVRMTQRQDGSGSSRSHSAARSASIARLIALRRGSLTMVTTAMCLSRVSTRISIAVLRRSLSLRGAQRRRNLVQLFHHPYEIASLRSQ